MTTAKKICMTVLIIIVALALILALVGNIFFSIALKADSPIGVDKMMTKAFTKNPTLSAGFSGFTGNPQEKEWFDGTKKDIYITSEDGLKLHGYKITNENGNGNYVVACHGYGCKANDMTRYAKHFYDMGYSLILPDARAHGQSEGNVKGMGWPERLDLLLWLDEIIKADPEAEIALFGVSMGGATVMMASGEEKLPSQVKAIIEDCGYSDVWEEFETQLKDMFHLPSFPVMNVSSIVTQIRGGYSLREASAVEQVKKSKTPTLFIHGSDDTFVPFSMLDKVYNAAACEKEKLVIEGAGHAMSSTKNPELYWSTVTAFLDKHM